MKEQGTEIRNKIARSFMASGLEAKRADDLAFHLTDWLSDIQEIQKLYSNISESSEAEIRRVLIKFLAHVPNHLAAAKQLVGLGPIDDLLND